jgi:hypothetical protein
MSSLLFISLLKIQSQPLRKRWSVRSAVIGFFPDIPAPILETGNSAVGVNN